VIRVRREIPDRLIEVRRAARQIGNARGIHGRAGFGQ
jgi:hypothetical protein